MSDKSIDNKLLKYRSLFKGREDVFALRWEKETKSGYMPAYFYDPFQYRAHKMKGGTFQNYTDKTYLPLTDDHIVKHLSGEQLIGLYPLLQETHRGSLLRILMKKTGWLIARNFLNVVKLKMYPVT